MSQSVSSSEFLSEHVKPPEALAGFGSIYVQNVVWNDMDAFNHVNNVVYYRYAESARINYLNELGAFSNEVTTVLAQSSCTYLKPVVFPDTLLIGVRTKKLGNTSIIMEYAYFSTAQQALVATGESVLVRLNKEGTKKLPWSTTERSNILAFEKAAGHSPQI
ncbi:MULTISPECIES: acyl-CoA thioesterase [Psychrobacter]|uniref:Acyl-CoA thioesterase n=2 Tax=Psychrobacter TaxID=497 RepID=A0A844M1K6_9GAMM|nr:MULTISPECIES: acyl-CoA thioesterase [Psychrobacter]MUG32635.1 acyl-CoA thioesterase [Psychrobacter sanguinis]UNK05295.1 acyl-CoA thioesterase [Psychrobacter sp. PraFG1]